MPLKPGGGDKPQNYDPKNGEYLRNPQCEEDEENLVLTKIFGLTTGKPIAFPIPSIHDNDYCELFIAYCVDKKDPIILDVKFTKYLMIYKANNDKSKFLKSMGYDLSNYKDVILQLENKTNFREISKIENQPTGLTFRAPTTIKNKIKEREDIIYSVWEVTKSGKLRFITIKGGKK